MPCLSLWKISRTCGQHQLTSDSSVNAGGPRGPPSSTLQGPLSIELPQERLPACPRRSAAAQETFEDADGDLEPPRRPLSAASREASQSQANPESCRGQGNQHQTEQPLDYFWVFQGNTRGLKEVGRGLWSAEILLGQFLLHHPNFLWGAPPKAPSRLRNTTPCCSRSKSEAHTPDASRNPHRETSEVYCEGTPRKQPRVFRVLELGCGVGFLGPLLSRVLWRQKSESGFSGLPSDMQFEAYLTDVDSGALQLCEQTQRLNEALLRGASLGWQGVPQESSNLGSGTLSDTYKINNPSEPSCSESRETLHIPRVDVRVRRLDWQQGGPWASQLRGGSLHPPEAACNRAPTGSNGAEFLDAEEKAAVEGSSEEVDPFAWSAEETAALQSKGIDLVLAADGETSRHLDIAGSNGVFQKKC